MDSLISRQGAIDALMSLTVYKSKREVVQAADKHENTWIGGVAECIDEIEDLPSAQPERLTDDDFETIRIHLNAYKEKLCNQQRWKEAEEYQRIIDRFMAFASAQRKGKWIYPTEIKGFGRCPHCKALWDYSLISNSFFKFCPRCGNGENELTELKGEEDVRKSD